jgi:Flp pilus assembly protein TadD
MCLDWLGRHAEAEKFFSEAERLSPNGEFVAGNIGWHYVQTGDYSAARQWLIRAGKTSNWRNETAKSYLFEVCEPRLMDRASGKLPISLFNDGKGR